jgi:ferredoxin
VCEPECPTEAIVPDTEANIEKWSALNAKFSALWPNITAKGPTPADADDYKGMPDKFDRFFSEKSGSKE